MYFFSDSTIINILKILSNETNFDINFSLFSVASFSQNVRGTVYGNDSGGKQPLPGVNIYWEGTTQGVVSNKNGEFRITQKSGQHMLVFSFVGYTPQTLHIHGTAPLDVTLEPTLEIDEVTIVQKIAGLIFRPLIRFNGAHWRR
jgi:hypothetical protein